MSDLIKVTGLWKNDRSEKKFWSGSISKADLQAALEKCGDCDKVKVLLFPNNQRTSKDAEFSLSIAPVTAQPGASPAAHRVVEASPFDVTRGEDDIPF